jgi:hypothetical protein
MVELDPATWFGHLDPFSASVFLCSWCPGLVHQRIGREGEQTMPECRFRTRLSAVSKRSTSTGLQAARDSEGQGGRDGWRWTIAVVVVEIPIYPLGSWHAKRWLTYPDAPAVSFRWACERQLWRAARRWLEKG